MTKGQFTLLVPVRDGGLNIYLIIDNSIPQSGFLI